MSLKDSKFYPPPHSWARQCLFVAPTIGQVSGSKELGAQGLQATSQEEQGSAPSNFDISNLATSPIDLTTLELELASYDSLNRECILDGFKDGFLLHYSGPHIALDTKI